MANPELPRRGRVLPWEVNRREQPINDCKTTVPASAAQFFSTAALASMERQFRYIRTVTVLIARELDMPAMSRIRNSRLQQQVRPRQRRRTDDAYGPPPVDPIEYSFCAIDPNHKNLCGYSIGSRIDNNNVDHQLLGLVLNPKARKMIHPPVLTHAPPHCYFVKNLHKYLNEIATPLMWVPTQEEISNPDFLPRTALDQLQINEDRRALRRNKFDFL
ncbi:hypothetical protein P9112_008860 [Eukaryota sp. TZLM1-RC]